MHDAERTNLQPGLVYALQFVQQRIDNADEWRRELYAEHGRLIAAGLVDTERCRMVADYHTAACDTIDGLAVAVSALCEALRGELSVGMDRWRDGVRGQLVADGHGLTPGAPLADPIKEAARAGEAS